MKYIITCNGFVKDTFDNLPDSQVKLNKYQTNNKKNNIYKIISIPDIGIGLKFYSCQTGLLVGEIMEESENLWFSKRKEDQSMLDPWLKCDFERKYVEELIR